MSKEQQSRLKELITRGREQGYLTYAEVNDHLPEDISDPEQVEDIIRMINDMGINVFETAPDADALLLAEADTDEAAAEEAAAALAAVETDIGRTTDPVRMYMREMGTVELLTREGEIEIAKRIEEGIREVMSAIAHFPGSIESILAEYQRVTSEGGRLSDILSGYIDPDDGSVPAEEVEPVDLKDDSASEKDDEEEEGDDSEEEEGDGGPDPEEALRRFTAVSEQLEKTRKTLKKHGRNSKQGVAELLSLAELFMPIKLVPKQYEALVAMVRDALEQVRAQERAIMQLCVRDARMPRADFLLVTGFSAGGAGSTVNYAAVRLPTNPKKAALLADSGPLFNVNRNDSPAVSPSVHLHAKVRSAWGVDGPEGVATKLITQFPQAGTVENLGSITTGLAIVKPEDRFSFLTFQRDGIYSAFSYVTFYPEIAAAESGQPRDTLINQKWMIEVPKWVDAMKPYPNVGYYVPFQRDLVKSHTLTLVTFSGTAIKEANISGLKVVVDDLIDGNGTPIRAYETQKNEQNTKTPGTLDSLLQPIYKLLGL